jgi:hypothetical protein
MKVGENRIVGRILVAKKGETKEIWRKLQNEKFFKLYFSPYIIRIIKLRMVTLVLKPQGRNN